MAASVAPALQAACVRNRSKLETCCHCLPFRVQEERSWLLLTVWRTVVGDEVLKPGEVYQTPQP